MTDTPATTLATTLQHCDMLIIDNLHAFDFSVAADGLRIECMDGRDLKRWHFTSEQVAAAKMNVDSHSWSLSDDHAEHQLICVEAFTGRDEDDAEQE